MIAVRKVEARHIHAGIHESSHVFLGPTGGSNGANNLGAAIGRVRAGLDAIQGNLASVEGRNGTGVGNHVSSM